MQAMMGGPIASAAYKSAMFGLVDYVFERMVMGTVAATTGTLGAYFVSGANFWTKLAINNGSLMGQIMG